MRRRKLKWLWARLKEIAAMEIDREELLMKLGAARAKAPTAWRLVEIEVTSRGATFSSRLDRNKLRIARRREGRYLLRTNLTEHDPAKLWTYYLQLVAVEEAFKNLKGDLAIRSDFPSARTPHRDAYLHRLPRLLSPRHATRTLACPRARPHPTQRAR